MKIADDTSLGNSECEWVKLGLFQTYCQHGQINEGKAYLSARLPSIDQMYCDAIGLRSVQP